MTPDLFLTRARQADLAAVKHFRDVVSDVRETKLRREDITKLIAAGNEMAGRLMLRAEPNPEEVRRLHGDIEALEARTA